MSFSISTESASWQIVLAGTLTDADLHELADTVLRLEAATAHVPNRVTDMTQLTRIEIGFREVLGLAERSRLRELPHPIRSALVVANPVQRAFARMFQALNDHPLVTIDIFTDLPSAVIWVRPGAA